MESIGSSPNADENNPTMEKNMFNGMTGKPMGRAFFGPCYYQRLKHMVVDKIHSRSGGKLVMMTRQPVEGRSRDGGLRIGEMERDVLLAHGVGIFAKERLMDVSDPYDTMLCQGCGFVPIYNWKDKTASCPTCRGQHGFAKIRMPYAAKLMLQELGSMHVGARLLT